MSEELRVVVLLSPVRRRQLTVEARVSVVSEVPVFLAAPRPAPSGLTPERLRGIADWIDGLRPSLSPEGGQAVRDLRRWADEMAGPVAPAPTEGHPATERVPLSMLPGRRLPGCSWAVVHFASTRIFDRLPSGGARHWRAYGGLHPTTPQFFSLADDGTVEVQAR